MSFTIGGARSPQDEEAQLRAASSTTPRSLGQKHWPSSRSGEQDADEEKMELWEVTQFAAQEPVVPALSSQNVKAGESDKGTWVEAGIRVEALMIVEQCIKMI